MFLEKGNFWRRDKLCAKKQIFPVMDTGRQEKCWKFKTIHGHGIRFCWRGKEKRGKKGRGKELGRWQLWDKVLDARA